METKKLNFDNSLKKVFIYLAASYVVLFALIFLLNPVINYFELKALLIQKFSYLLPNQLVASIFNRYIFFISFVGIYLFIRIVLNKKKFSETVIYPQKTSFKYFFIGLTMYPILKTTILLIGLITGYAQLIGFSTNSWSIIFSAIFLDFFIKLSNDIAEEIAFRGYTLNTLTQAINPHLACFISAFIFALVHLINMRPEFLFSQFLFGLLAAYLFIIYKDLYLTIGLHLGANVLTNQLFGYGQIIKTNMPYTFAFTMETILLLISIFYLINLVKKKNS